MNAYNFYINSLFNGLEASHGFITGMYGFTNIIFIVVAIFMIHLYGRKLLLFWGFIGMGFFQMLVGVCLYNHSSYLTFIGALGFVSLNAISSGPITWIYMAEVMSDTGLSIGSFILQSSTLLVSSITLPIKHWLGPHHIGAIFVFFGILNFLGAIFTSYFVKETKGKS